MSEDLIAKYVTIFNEQCYTGDLEVDHAKADEILCQLLTELGFGEIVDKYEDVEKWYA